MSEYIKSPLKYTGNKFKLLDQLHEVFPKDINTLYDVFCGGLTVALNTDAQHKVACDICEPVINLYEYLYKTPVDDILDDVNRAIALFNLNRSNYNGYRAMREEYNRFHDPVLLYLLCCSSYNNQCKINSVGDFIETFGHRMFHKEANIRAVKERLDAVDYTFYCDRYYNVLGNKIAPNDFVYCDPPYLITGAHYNKIWNLQDEYALYKWLDDLDEIGVLFGLSNVMMMNGRYNHVLANWAKKYNVKHLTRNYSHCNAQKVGLVNNDEVFICNY